MRSAPLSPCPPLPNSSNPPTGSYVTGTPCPTRTRPHSQRPSPSCLRPTRFEEPPAPDRPSHAQFAEDAVAAPLERVGLSSYEAAHHITDMYHHRAFRGTYTKTLQPSGCGEIAAREAVGLPPLDALAGGDGDEVDECVLWSPTNEGVCLQWASEDDAWRQRRFERVQMEGTRDPRRGGSGTTR